MRRWNPAWYVLLAVVGLVPAGWRVLTCGRARHHVPDAALVQAGEALFTHEWTANDPLSPGGDGLGPVFNARSCVACHKQSGVGGAGGLLHNVTTFTVRLGKETRQGVVHAQALRYPETLAHVHSSLPAVSQPSLDMVMPVAGRPHRRIAMPSGLHLSQRNTPALFGARLIDEIPEGVILAEEKTQRIAWGLAGSADESTTVGRALRLSGGRVGRFGWKAQSASLSDFVQAACANELGLGNPGQAQPAPLGKPDYRAPGLDLTAQQCDQLTGYIASLSRPVERAPAAPGEQLRAVGGKQLFHSVGCADCHTPNLGNVEGLYSDLLLHRMGQELEGGGSYNDPPRPIPEADPNSDTHPGEWRTPPLWGVADSGPYLHDGRAATLDEAIRLHRGQAARSAQRYAELGEYERGRLLAFLNTLRAP